MGTYALDVSCPRCGRRHRLSNGLILRNGPGRSGSLAELYGDSELPPELARLLHDLVWCDQSAAYIQDHDPARVYLTPSPPPPPLER